jgi:phosphatidylserine decarboxylase
MIDFLFPKLHKEGYRFVAIAAIATFLLLLISNLIGLISLALTIWVYYFFRDPEKQPINDEQYLLSPADGVISSIVKIKGPTELGLENKEFTRVSIFMNVFNCHVNRSPCYGEVNQIFYKKGKYFNASLDKASDENERNFIKIKSTKNDELVIVQIAGLIARRIVCEVKENEKVNQADKIGIIRFGSRVDLYFDNHKLLVRQNQKTIGGETIIAKRN